VPLGLFFGRLANFVNGELWRKPADVPWAIVFPGSHDGVARFVVEFFREPDAQLVEFAARTGLHRGQWLTIPMIAGGLYLVATARGRIPPSSPVPSAS
jgi:phosphatidylglycerol:prolipoprotein diacylglycerol transferase